MLSDALSRSLFSILAFVLLPWGVYSMGVNPIDFVVRADQEIGAPIAGLFRIAANWRFAYG